jgi:hypothetical protein
MSGPKAQPFSQGNALGKVESLKLEALESAISSWRTKFYFALSGLVNRLATRTQGVALAVISRPFEPELLDASIQKHPLTLFINLIQ